MHSKVPLDSIPSLTFYNGEYTTSRRSSPIPQLKCVGKPCSLFQPDVVKCVNDGGRGLDVQWKCEADLPEQLRFGRVEVSCEGWSRPGDPMVLKGSCGLEYRLVRVPNAYLNNGDVSNPFYRLIPKDPYEAVFVLVWGLVLLFILYAFLKSWLGSRTQAGTTPNPPPNPHPGPGTDSWWFGGSGRRPGGGGGDPPPPPPPYSRHEKRPSSNSSSWWPESTWRPGFWSGLGLGGLAATLWNSQQQRRNDRVPPPPPPPVVPQWRSMWDWERPAATSSWGRTPAPSPATTSTGSWFGGSSAMPRQTWTNSNDRGEGTSSLGRMRSSTGYGGSTVR